MAITVHVTNGAEVPPSTPLRLAIEDDGYYWHLHDMFVHLRQRTGQYIAVADDAVFAGKDLDALREELRDVRRALKHAPRQWQVTTGQVKTRIGRRPTLRKMEEPVLRERMQELVERLLALASEARESNRALFFLGD